MGREIKFRAWTGSAMRQDVIVKNGDAYLYDHPWGASIATPPRLAKLSGTPEQFTGLKDKNGVEIYEGDLLNVFFTSGEGEHIHDCVYQACIGAMGDLQLHFRKLLWVSFGYNQYTIDSTLSMEYGNLECLWQNETKIPAVRDTYGENHIHRQKWKCLDKSTYFEVIGNIHQNPELLS